MVRTALRTLLVACGATLAVAATAQTVGPQNPPLIIRSLAGKDSFEFYCAGCHGRDGRGEGSVTQRLKTKPPDLRLLAQRNGGDFPRERVLQFVTSGNGSSSGHRSDEMPQWGRAFEGLERSDALVKVRIENIVNYLASIQLK